MKMYAASLLALKQETLRIDGGSSVRQTASHAVAFETCENEDEARGRFYKKLKDMYPSSTGYSNWDVAIIEIGKLT